MILKIDTFWKSYFKTTRSYFYDDSINNQFNRKHIKTVKTIRKLNCDDDPDQG